MFNREKARWRKERQRETRKYLPLAEEIGKRVSEELASLDVGDFDAAYEQIIKDATAQEKQRQFSELFRQLSLERRQELLLRQFDDDELREALAVERQTILQRDKITALREDAKRNRWIDLRQIPAGTIMTVSLYNKENYEECETASELIDYDDPERYLRFVAMEEGVFKVIEDAAYEDGNAAQLLTYQMVKLGSWVNSGDGSTLMPYLYYGSKLDCEVHGSVQPLNAIYGKDHTDLVVGKLELGGIEIMGENLD